MKQGIDRELENKTLQFLRDNDSEYFKKRGKKSNKIDYPYLSAKQTKTVSSLEIPLSNLSNKQRLQCPQIGDGHDYYE